MARKALKKAGGLLLATSSPASILFGAYNLATGQFSASGTHIDGIIATQGRAFSGVGGPSVK